MNESFFSQKNIYLFKILNWCKIKNYIFARIMFYITVISDHFRLTSFIYWSILSFSKKKTFLLQGMGDDECVKREEGGRWDRKGRAERIGGRRQWMRDVAVAVVVGCGYGGDWLWWMDIENSPYLCFYFLIYLIEK